MFDLLASMPQPDEVLGPNLKNLPKMLEQIRGLTAFACYRQLLAHSEGLHYLMLFKKFFPYEYEHSQETLAHETPHRTNHVLRNEQIPRFSGRECQFFELVAERLFPLQAGYYEAMTRVDTTENLPMLCEFYGIDLADMPEEPSVPRFILVASANAFINDSLWSYHLQQLGLSFIQHLPRCLKADHALGTHSLHYDAAAIFSAMAALDPIWRWLPEAWDYVTAQTRSMFLNYTIDHMIEDRSLSPEWNERDMRDLAADWAIAEPILDHTTQLMFHMGGHPEQVQMLLELIGRHHTVNGHQPLPFSEFEMAWIGEPAEHAAYLDRQEEQRLHYVHHPPEHHYPPHLRVFDDLSGVQHAP